MHKKQKLIYCDEVHPNFAHLWELFFILPGEKIKLVMNEDPFKIFKPTLADSDYNCRSIIIFEDGE